MLRVGRFSEYGHQEMAECIRRAMCDGDTPCEVHVVADTHDWYKFFAPMSLMTHGMAITDSEAAMNHSMRFIRRAGLKNYQVKGMAYDWKVEQVLHHFRIVKGG